MVEHWTARSRGSDFKCQMLGQQCCVLEQNLAGMIYESGSDGSVLAQPLGVKMANVQR